MDKSYNLTRMTWFRTSLLVVFTGTRQFNLPSDFKDKVVHTHVNEVCVIQ